MPCAAGAEDFVLLFYIVHIGRIIRLELNLAVAAFKIIRFKGIFLVFHIKLIGFTYWARQRSHLRFSWLMP